ncbi:MAG: hypothetical protein J3Q66DRAFT_79424 [Benniella sp.]|nr:MAG: hypothetical protein J3Q66DRAFT_79424 [Benniella sp.]
MHFFFCLLSISLFASPCFETWPTFLKIQQQDTKTQEEQISGKELWHVAIASSGPETLAPGPPWQAPDESRKVLRDPIETLGSQFLFLPFFLFRKISCRWSTVSSLSPFALLQPY